MTKVAETIIRALLFVVFFSVTMTLIGQTQDFKMLLLWSVAGFFASLFLTKIVIRMIRGGGKQ